MKQLRKLWVIGLAVVLFSAVAFTQRQDLDGMVSGVTVLGAASRANSSSTSGAMDLANYAGALIVATTGQADNGVAATYLVLQDSGASWVNRDSVLLDSVDNKYYKMPYRGANRYIRVVQRATGSAGDTIASAVILIRGGARSR